jgi:signal transduction histidine kinase
MEADGRRLSRLSGALGSVRARTTIVGVVVVAAALAVGALGLVSLLRSSMTEGVETTAMAQLNDVVSLVRIGHLPAQLPSGRGDSFSQVVSPDGRVLASSATLLASTPVSRAQPGEEGIVIHTIPTLLGDGLGGGVDPDGPYLLLAEQVSATDARTTGPVTVYVAATLHPVEAATSTVAMALSGGLPILVLLVGALIWILGGRALHPVEAIRAEVADISGHDLHRRVPEPATRDEVAHLARTMNEMLNRLESSADAQRRFVADASHELRSPLAAIQAMLEVSIRHPDAAAWPSVAADTLDETRRLRRLVDDLLVLARAGEPGMPERHEEIDLDEIVMREARATRAESSVAIDLHKVSGGRVTGDPDQLTRVVRNLLDNAQRHAAHRVWVELSSSSGWVILAVEDDGPGIPPAERERIFERFARLDEARDQDAGGTGLGLAIAKQLVEAHGGTIAALDGSAGGARLEVRLPAPDDGVIDDGVIDDEGEDDGAVGRSVGPVGIEPTTEGL